MVHGCDKPALKRRRTTGWRELSSSSGVSWTPSAAVALRPAGARQDRNSPYFGMQTAAGCRERWAPSFSAPRRQPPGLPPPLGPVRQTGTLTAFTTSPAPTAAAPMLELIHRAGGVAGSVDGKLANGFHSTIPSSPDQTSSISSLRPPSRRGRPRLHASSRWRRDHQLPAVTKPPLGPCLGSCGTGRGWPLRQGAGALRRLLAVRR